MKKILSIILAITMVFCTAFAFNGCSNNKNIDVALITTGNGVKNAGYDKITWDGIKDYCKKNKLKANFFDVQNDLSIESIATAIENAVNANAKYVVLPGEDFAVSAYKIAPNYPDVNFVLINAIPHSEDDNVLRIQQNVMMISFDALSVGYLNGYMDVVNGNNNLAYICQFNSTNSGDYGSGYVTGASDASDSLRKDVTLNYADFDSANLSYNYSLILVPHYKNVESVTDKYSVSASVDNFDKTFVIVQEGKGSGTYKAGESVNISANAEIDGNAFDYWSCEDCDGNEIAIEFENKNSYTTSFTMIDRFPSLIQKMANDGANVIFSGGNSKIISMYKSSVVSTARLNSERFVNGTEPQIILDYGRAVSLALEDFKGGSFLQADCSNFCIKSSLYSLNDKDKNYNSTYEKVYKKLGEGKIEITHVQSGGDIRKAVKTNNLKLNYWINK